MQLWGLTARGGRRGFVHCQKQDLPDFGIGQDWEMSVMERFQSW